MRHLYKQICLVVSILFIFSVAVAATAPNCEQVLSTSSDKFIQQYGVQHGGTSYATQDAIKLYRDCYAGRINAISNSLDQSGRGPLMGANGDFHEMENALNVFTQKALAATAGGGSYDALKAAYTYLYALQFRYDFYQQYVHPGKSMRDSDHDSVVLQANAYLQSLIDKLPLSSREEVQSSFYDFETAAVKGSGLSALKVYQYAISILQSPADKPYSPPPF